MVHVDYEPPRRTLCSQPGSVADAGGREFELGKCSDREKHTSRMQLSSRAVKAVANVADCFVFILYPML